MLSCFDFVCFICNRNVRAVLAVTYVAVIFCFNSEEGNASDDPESSI